jgi:hypothetical protein
MNAIIERMAGAKDCIATLVKLEESAENLPPEANDAAVYAAIQLGDAELWLLNSGH